LETEGLKIGQKIVMSLLKSENLLTAAIRTESSKTQVVAEKKEIQPQGIKIG
jgi:hypothetical protein